MAFASASERAREWRKVNRERFNAYQREYKRQKRAEKAVNKRFIVIEPRITPEELDEVLIQQAGRCAYCRKRRQKSTLQPFFDLKTDRFMFLTCPPCAIELRVAQRWISNPNYQEKVADFFKEQSDSLKETGLPATESQVS